MKYKRTRGTENAGLLHVETIVNAHGSIFRRVHLENDIGIDGYIEIVESESATGKLIAVQVKAGESYVSPNEAEFSVCVDQPHIEYWCNHPVPVILICYSPVRRIAAWTSISQFLECEQYHNRIPIKKITIPFFQQFDTIALDRGIRGLADANKDRRILIKCADRCLTGSPSERAEGLSILSAHPDSKSSMTTLFLARRLLFDSNNAVADIAVITIGLQLLKRATSWYPNNEEENKSIDYAAMLCRDISERECKKLIARIGDNEWEGDLDNYGECVYAIMCTHPNAQAILEEIAADKSQPMNLRLPALYMVYECDYDDLMDCRFLEDDPFFGDVYQAMFPANLTGDC